ncbi:DM13 domain-containing protein [Candidatus Haliotispira prima]|uniref:DM13 domain-containing protein n=1 Tax=Candidatus Haliotispira prima TaxID=3034016 RepID=A0ABY8MNF4_9SPIO|nr:DM13 domain-containing protein [Candidatus Haliotispira prima]
MLKGKYLSLGIVPLLSAVFFFLLVPASFVSLSAQGEKVVAEGNWTKVLYTAKGRWQIVEKGGKLQLQLDADFQTTNAPDLNILFSPREAGTLTSKNVMKGALRAGELKGKSRWGKLKGPITLDLPANLDLTKYKTIIIHCIEYSKLWSVGKL